MDNGNSTGLLATLTGFIVTVGVAIAAAVKGYGWVFDKTHTQDEVEEHTAEGARAALDDVQKEWFDGMRQDLRDARAENTMLRRDRDRGWDLARAWREMCRNERHERNNLLQRVGGEPPEQLPSLEDIEGKKSS